MKINLAKYLEAETTLVQQLFVELGWNLQDDIWCAKEFAGRNILLCIYPELLSYGYVYRAGYGQSGNEKEKRTYEEHTIPWIACRIEIEDEKPHNDILKGVKEWLNANYPLKPFYDEDATFGIFAKKCSAYSRDWTKYIFYVNPDFPDGWWENHTLA